ncbi:peptidase domain-containing ABC transporter [Fischerella thermalis]|uniref:Peptide-transporting ATPase n=1 Tax=Fischerella thermalis JSC-11 TaxID=741277 RepID=G6FU72_9CYAN|nr:peptidase domain-containing ABC transporter [Fischerella thermalis]EHC12802.1 Peptide-transporting ATPase [Fischerella thermalis JSC-11]PLZ21283.1 ABC transporter ATP-binding protein [Fischerella thermalis WC341]PLZ33484.1 ABC transporter ATP-binding protein [Fischerella thermalis WC559]PLZ34890.1 ABC transporter ATP-binding protein [Fischerella thermalis WC558]PLZ41979.1 ABC transporter ATP-binding protein [Fischerella thermalis WC542]
MKYAHVLQHSKEDCGAACLASITKYYGRNFTLNQIREVVGTGQFGTTLLGLKRGAERLGFNARPVKTSPEVLKRINEAPLPAIIHWKGHHWVVLYGKKGKKCVVADPAVGLRYLSPQDLAEGWADWLMLLLEPDPIRFYAQENHRIGSFWGFFKRIWNFRGILAQALPLNCLLGLLALASPFLLQILTDDVLVRGDTKLLTTIAIAVVVMNVISSSLSWVQSNLIAHFAQRLQLGLVIEFGRQILQLPLSYYETHRSGEIVSRLQDIHQINQLVSQVVVILPNKLFVAIISLGFMAFYSHKLTILALVISILMVISTVIFQPSLQQKTREVLVTESEVQGVLVETFKGAITLKNTTALPQFLDELQSRFGRISTLKLSTIQISINNNIFSNLVSGIGSVVLLWFGGNLVINPDENLSIGQLLAFNSMNGNFINLIATLITFVDEFTRVKTATQRLTEVIDTTPENQGDETKQFATISGDADITCSNISFHYPGQLELLEDFSLTIPGGKNIAIIGKSGCGKSTLAKIIAGLYSIKSGNIRLGIYNLEDLCLDCLRQQVILVPQDAHFWNRSIIENFRLGAPYLTFEQIVRASQVTEADDFISKLPNKYQTIVGEFGANLSGGQRQRLAIARAIVTDPPVLILDESTSGLDPVSEARVLDRLLKHRHGKTTILISHRPQVINRADWIVLLDQGKLKIQGSLVQLRYQSGEHLKFLNP